MTGRHLLVWEHTVRSFHTVGIPDCVFLHTQHDGTQCHSKEVVQDFFQDLRHHDCSCAHHDPNKTNLYVLLSMWIFHLHIWYEEVLELNLPRFSGTHILQVFILWLDHPSLYSNTREIENYDSVWLGNFVALRPNRLFPRHASVLQLFAILCAMISAYSTHTHTHKHTHIHRWFLLCALDAHLTSWIIYLQKGEKSTIAFPRQWSMVDWASCSRILSIRLTCYWSCSRNTLGYIPFFNSVCSSRSLPWTWNAMLMHRCQDSLTPYQGAQRLARSEARSFMNPELLNLKHSTCPSNYLIPLVL